MSSPMYVLYRYLDPLGEARHYAETLLSNKAEKRFHHIQPENESNHERVQVCVTISRVFPFGVPEVHLSFLAVFPGKSAKIIYAQAQL